MNYTILSISKTIFLHQNKILMRVNFINNIITFQSTGKSQNTVGLAEEIGCGNDIVLSIICQRNEPRQNKNK